jgi:hypothetical protein
LRNDFKNTLCGKRLEHTRQRAQPWRRVRPRLSSAPATRSPISGSHQENKDALKRIFFLYLPHDFGLCDRGSTLLCHLPRVSSVCTWLPLATQAASEEWEGDESCIDIWRNVFLRPRPCINKLGCATGDGPCSATCHA